MKAIISIMLTQDATVSQAASAYIDGIFNNEDIAPATRIREHLAQFGLECKDPNGWKMAYECWDWQSRRNEANCNGGEEAWFPTPPRIITRRTEFSLCGRLVGHLSVCGWLCVACGILKRRASSVAKGWDDKTRDALLERMVPETVRSVQRDDPAHGDWCAEGQELNVSVDASSLAIGVALERHEAVLEDACWLRPENDAQHINLAELDAVLKGINLALQSQCRVLRIKIDSACVYHWLLDTLTGRARVRTKTASEMLIRRRLNTLKDLVAEYHLTVDVTLVPSTLNQADRLTRVPQRWFDAMKRGNGTRAIDWRNTS